MIFPIMKFSNITKAAVAVLAMSMAFSSCSKKDDIITTLSYSRNFEPTSFEASVVDNVKASFTWVTNKTPEKYIIELYKDSIINPDSLVSTIEVANTFGTTDNPYVTDELLPKHAYTARIKAVGNGKEDSYWAEMEEYFTTKSNGGGESEVVTKTASLSFTAGDAVAASYTVGCLTMNITDTDGKFTIDANTAYFGDPTNPTKYTARLKTGGKSSGKSGITLVSTGTGKVSIAVRTASSSSPRSLVVSKDEVEVANFTASEDNATKEVVIEGEEAVKSVYNYFTFTIVPGTYQLTYPDGAVNFYGFEVTYTEQGGSTEPTEPAAAEGSLNFGEAAASVADGQVFTFGGATIAVNNGNGKFTIDLNTQYFGDATAQTKYLTRMKSGGASGATNGVTLTLIAKGTVTIAMRSSSGSADRTVELLNAEGTSVQKWTVGDSNATSGVTIDGEAEPKKVFNTYAITLDAGTYSFSYDGGLNFYGFNYAPAK